VLPLPLFPTGLDAPLDVSEDNEEEEEDVTGFPLFLFPREAALRLSIRASSSSAADEEAEFCVGDEFWTEIGLSGWETMVGLVAVTGFANGGLLIVVVVVVEEEDEDEDEDQEEEEDGSVKDERFIFGFVCVFFCSRGELIFDDNCCGVDEPNPVDESWGIFFGVGAARSSIKSSNSFRSTREDTGRDILEFTVLLFPLPKSSRRESRSSMTVKEKKKNAIRLFDKNNNIRNTKEEGFKRVEGF